MLIAVTGFAGAGKSTSVRYLAQHLPGREVYVGQQVKDEVKRRNLDLTPDNEKRIREEVRQEEGDDAFARRALPRISELLETTSALIDAIYVKAEWELYRSEFQDRAVLFKVETPQAVRIERLASRECRPLTSEDVKSRDLFELQELKLADVFGLADIVVRNEGDRPALHSQLDDLISQWRG
jgi:dephospho-CoA kinase